MMTENINLVDSLGIVKKDSRLSSNQIKTRKASFLSISEHWRKFRFELLNKKLNRLKNNFVEESYKVDSSNQLPKNLESTVLKKAEAIARLEEKIKILSKESVPSNYVRSRAIKLRNKMMSTMTYNCNNAYSIGIEQYDSVFGEDKSETFSENVEKSTDNIENVFINPAVSPAAAADTSDNSLVSVENKESIEQPIGVEESKSEELPLPDYSSALGQPIEQGLSVMPERGLSNVSEQNVVSTPASDTMNVPVSGAMEAPVQGDDSHITLVSPEDVADAVKNAFNDVTISDNVVDNSSSNDFDSSSIGDSETNAMENDAKGVDVISFENSPKEDDNSSIDYSDIKNEIASSLERVRVSQNGSTEAKINQFDNDGNDVGKFDYTQMTDEEIQQSREKIEYDKYEDLYRREWEERKQGLVNSLQDIKNNAFKTTSNNTTNDVVDTYSSGMYNDTVDYTIPSGDNVNIRGDILVAPERNISVPSYVHQEQSQISDADSIEESIVDSGENMADAERKDSNLHMDYSDATENDVLHAFGRESTVEGLEALKQRALKLREKNKASKMDREAARRKQVEEAEKALQIRREKDQKRDEYNRMYKKLEDYCAALEEDTQAQIRSAETAINDAQCNRRFIESLVAEMDDYDKKMGEINSIISSDDDIESKRR